MTDPPPRSGDTLDLERGTGDPPGGPVGGVAATLEAAAARADAAQEQKVSWLELFFDLVFVVAFDQLAKRLGGAPTFESVAEFTLLFAAVWWAWSGNTVYAARYGNEERLYRWGTLGELVSMGMIALTVRGDLSDIGGFFALAFGVNRAIQAVLNLRVGRRSPEFRGFARRLGLTTGLSALVWVGSVLLPWGSGAQLLAWTLALLLEVLAPVLMRDAGRAALPHAGHLPERVGLLQIIALGEIVTEVVGGARQQRLSVATLLPSLLAIILAVSLWRLYFDQARGLPLLGAHLQGRVSSMLAWLYAHFPFTLAVVMLSVGAGRSISSASAQQAATLQQFVAWPLAGALATLAFLRWTTLRLTGQRADRSLWALLLGAALAALLGPTDLDPLRLHALAAALAVTVAVVVAGDPSTRRLGQIEERVTARLEEEPQA
ncbi:low temperature requirement protein A [Deinococcus petrolearius]|uniref:Low temperature requirement protein A n=1 Tax=Deinococcus petrolearius TaxID=1751295 RepID=A0ABW1DIL1_9DEIO